MKRINLIMALLLVGLAACQPKSPTHTNDVPASIHAVRIDYPALSATTILSDEEERVLQKEGINLVAVGAGRVDWNYFPWSGHNQGWSRAVRESGVDFVARDASRFSRWAQVSVVVDVLAPLYIQQHPQAAALSWGGAANPELVSLTEMTSGAYSAELLAFLSAVSAQKNILSVTLVEMFYYVDGFGADDLLGFKKDSGLTDWPRLPSGEININAPAVSQWRAKSIVSFLGKAAEIVHANGKQLWLEVKPNAYQLGTQDWSEYAQYLAIADRLVIFGNPIFEKGLAQARLTTGNLDSIGQGHLIYEIGLWKEEVGTIPAAKTVLSTAEISALTQVAFGSGIQDFWLTPNYYLTADTWSAIDPYLSGSGQALP